MNTTDLNYKINPSIEVYIFRVTVKKKIINRSVSEKRYTDSCLKFYNEHLVKKSETLIYVLLSTLMKNMSQQKTIIFQKIVLGPPAKGTISLPAVNSVELSTW